MASHTIYEPPLAATVTNPAWDDDEQQGHYPALVYCASPWGAVASVDLDTMRRVVVDQHDLHEGCEDVDDAEWIVDVVLITHAACYGEPPTQIAPDADGRYFLPESWNWGVITPRP